MVAMYTIAGRQVGSHILSIATLSVLFGGTAFAMAGGEKKKTDTTSVIKSQTSSDDEFKFIQDFLANEEKKEKKAAH